MPLADSYEQILADPQVDAVVLATPHSQHEQQVLAAAAAGKHILVEKPITLTRASADAVVAAARKAGVVLAVGFCRPLPSVDGRGAKPARRTDGSAASSRHGGAAHHQHRPVHPADNWRADPEEAPAGA